jgi:hypothetical protein
MFLASRQPPCGGLVRPTRTLRTVAVPFSLALLKAFAISGPQTSSGTGRPLLSRQTSRARVAADRDLLRLSDGGVVATLIVRDVGIVARPSNFRCSDADDDRGCRRLTSEPTASCSVEPDECHA